MLDQARGSDYAIWAVALLLYVGDAARLLSARELLLHEAGRGRFASVFSEAPFTIAGRVLAFAPLLSPHRGIFIAPWGLPWIDPAGLAAALEPLERLRRALWPMRIVAAGAFGLLFVVGPVLTMIVGTSAAIVYTAALLYPTLAVAIVMLWCRRAHFALTAARCAWISVEIAVCPAFLPNVVRKITGVHPLGVDGAQILLATSSPDVQGEFLRRLKTRINDVIDEVSDEPALQRELRAYLATVGSAR